VQPALSQQDPQTGASHQRALVYKQIAQGCCVIADWPGVEIPDIAVIVSA